MIAFGSPALRCRTQRSWMRIIRVSSTTPSSWPPPWSPSEPELAAMSQPYGRSNSHEKNSFVEDFPQENGDFIDFIVIENGI